MGPYPIIEYAHKIGKNTADFTLKDFAGYMKWWMKQPIRVDLEKVMKKETMTIKKSDIAVLNVGKLLGMSKVPVDAQQVETEDAEEIEEQVTEELAIVAELGLTQFDVDVLSWAVMTILSEFDFSESEAEALALTGIGQALEPLVTKGK